MNDVLVVDDNPDNITVLLNILSQNGYQVRPALSGQIALKAVQEAPPAIILLDVMMPGMDGFETCARLKSDTSTRHIPVIFISALGNTEVKVKGFRVGGVDYISKPFNADEVLARIDTHLRLRNIQLQLLSEIEERQFAENALQAAHAELEQRVASRTAELNRQAESLAETNIALKVLLEKREEDRKDLERNMLFNIEKLLLPYLDKLSSEPTEKSRLVLLRVIRSNLEEIATPLARKYTSQLANLTPTQVQIAGLIKQGMSTKEIASLLNLSPQTIACHRQEIRKRLSLTNKKVNLRTALIAQQNN